MKARIGWPLTESSALSIYTKNKLTVTKSKIAGQVDRPNTSWWGSTMCHFASLMCSALNRYRGMPMSGGRVCKLKRILHFTKYGGTGPAMSGSRSIICCGTIMECLCGKMLRAGSFTSSSSALFSVLDMETTESRGGRKLGDQCFARCYLYCRTVATWIGVFQ